MAMIALALYGLYGALAFDLRVAVHFRRTGTSGVRGVSGAPGSVEWLAGIGFVLALAVGVAAPALATADLVEPIEALDRTVIHAIGIVAFALGLAGTVLAQAAMGASWRIGVDEREQTELVTGGPFAIVRNPIYAAMIPAIGGLALLVPSVVALAGWLLLVAALEAQTRLVEEPHLLRTHGNEYALYAARVGRFVPGIGQLRARRG
jgi:protein-S-isoprenylcysteine O-methyltransferase Ste14